MLFFLAPGIAEMLLGNEPPLRFFTVGDLIILTFLYGSGALLAREAVRSWGKGYPSLLFLGAAYAIFEEGLVCKSFFDPRWPDLGALRIRDKITIAT